MPQEIVLRLQMPTEGQPALVQQMENTGDPKEFSLPNAPLFGGLSRDTLRAIAAASRKRAFGASSTIYEEGEVADSVYVVVSGEVRRYRVDRETSTRENMVTLNVVPAGGTVGENALISPLRTESAEAVRRVECLQWTKDELMTLMVQHPLFGLAVSQAAIQRAAEAETRVCGFGSGRWAGKRLADLLLKLAEQEGSPVDDGVEIQRPLTQSDLASIIQAARETVSITMKRFREAGGIRVNGKRITVVPARLREVAGV